MKFTDFKVNKVDRFSIGIEEDSGDYYVSIPVANPYVDYEEYYRISSDSFHDFSLDMATALPFVQKCREQKNDHLLIQLPGKLRGEAQ